MYSSGKCLIGSVHPLVRMMVIVPLPRVWIRVRLTTAFPESPAAFTGPQRAYSPTGCLTGRRGRIKIRALMSPKVTSPSSTPPGFTTVNGYATPTPLLLLLSRPTVT